MLYSKIPMIITLIVCSRSNRGTTVLMIDPARRLIACISPEASACAPAALPTSSFC
jgi:hypothetical protein